MAVATGKKVTIEYVLSLKENEEEETHTNKKRLTFIQGYHQIIPGLEKEVEGMDVGDVKKIQLEPDDAYGPVMEDVIIPVDKKKLPPGARKINAKVQTKRSDGRIIHGHVKEIRDDKAVLDFNHPLAGKTVIFQIKIVKIQ
ncbi:MAG TPA: FKBP-type peptidyl-prolyl cis-trans isomerase [Deltaproteobacteria bacterium]|nr:FKBP-type peptidyl-prolyl cis-trans isomerase [Deltaproteobacteria bacterium]HPJ92351.1 FKBP-type peptidyl-prolyl cis-trans isomerase [Deltaproteobacteria bacterium]HPR50914.1 FKBP-type peptidyl-prolyl cis-trans isomerase [Deltaproteobacteria bacterium]